MKIRSLTTILSLAALMVSGLAVAQKQPTPAPGAKHEIKASTSVKTMQPRDPKTGRFIKAGVAHAKMTPARDPKTGRFISAKKPTAVKPKIVKKATARDPKTGRFVSTKKS